MFDFSALSLQRWKPMILPLYLSFRMMGESFIASYTSSYVSEKYVTNSVIYNPNTKQVLPLRNANSFQTHDFLYFNVPPL